MSLVGEIDEWRLRITDAHDVIMYLTFSNTLGFLDAGGDIENFMFSLDKNMNRSGLVSSALVQAPTHADENTQLTTMPWTAYILKYNPIVGFFSKDSTMFPEWSGKQIQKRIAAKQEGDSKIQVPPRDFMDRFLTAARTDNPPDYNVLFVMNWTLVNIMAGADTTAIGLRAILYYLLKSPPKRLKLLEEIRSADLSYPVSWKESQQLPYLDACVKEAFRLHPAIGLGLERTVPPAGLQLPDGYVLPAGTNVSMNAWVVNRQALFGEKVDEFIPERWLQQENEGAEEYKERVAQMKRADLVFGSGSRACTGKYISLLEIYKVIPTLFIEFDISLVDEAEELATINRWTVRQENIRCWLKRRAQGH